MGLRAWSLQAKLYCQPCHLATETLMGPETEALLAKVRCSSAHLADLSWTSETPSSQVRVKAGVHFLFATTTSENTLLHSTEHTLTMSLFLACHGRSRSSYLSSGRLAA